VFLWVSHAPILTSGATASEIFWNLLHAHYSGVFKGGGPLCEPPPPFGRTAVIFVTISGLFLAPFRDKIAATSDQIRFFGPENALICVCGRGSAPDPAGGAYSAPSAANLFTVDSRRVVPAR